MDDSIWFDPVILNSLTLFCLVQSSVTLVQIYRFTGLNSPCKWFIGVGICTEFFVPENADNLILFHSYYPFSVFVLVFSSCLPGCHIDKVGAVRQIEHRAVKRVFGIFLAQRLHSFAQFGGLPSVFLVKPSYITLHLPP